MREVVTSLDVRADIKTVWAVLMDFAAYGDWNPFIRQVSGPPGVGGGLEVRMTIVGDKHYVFRPVVIRMIPLSEFAWRGQLGVRGLFDGEHIFRLESKANGLTRFIHTERFSGLLVAFLGGAVIERVTPCFEAMNRALRDQAEARVTIDRV